MTLLKHTLSTTDSEVVKVEELMFFAFMLIATTIVDLAVVELKQPAAKVLLSTLLSMLSAAAVVLYCANMLTSDTPPNARPLAALRAMSLVLAVAVAITTIVVQNYLRINETKGTSPIQVGQGTPQTQLIPRTGGRP